MALFSKKPTSKHPILQQPDNLKERHVIERTHVTVASYNIHLGIGSDGDFEPERIAAVIEETQADIVALQEVALGQPGFNILEYLSKACRMQGIAGPTFSTKHGYYGNAVLSRLPISSTHRLNISVPRCEPRGALDIEFDCGSRSLRVVATHLGLWPGERRNQIRRLLSHIRDAATLPLVMIGDVNEWFLWGRPVRWLHRHFEQSPSPATFPARLPIFALDRVWVKPLSALQHVTAHVTPLSRKASDHLPIKASIDLGSINRDIA